MRFLLTFFRRCSLTISYHAICVNTHINLFLHSSTLSREEQKKRLMNDVHANKYSYLFIGSDYVMRYQFPLEDVGITTEFIEQ